MSPAERSGAIERFDYSPIGNQWAVLRLLARLGADGVAPTDPAPAGKLLVTPAGSDRPRPYPARACMLERRLLPGSTGDELLWRASFALPLELVRNPQTVFRLLSPGAPALALPTPGLRVITRRELALAAARPTRQDRVPVFRRGMARHRLAAMATAVAVTTTSTPAAAAAALSATSSSSSGSSAPASIPAGVTTDAATPALTTPTATSAPTTTPATTTTTTAAATAPATISTTAPATTATPAPGAPSPATTSTPAGAAGAVPQPVTTSTGDRHVVSVTPTTATSRRHAAPTRLGVAHLFTAVAQTAHQRPAHPAHQRSARPVTHRSAHPGRPAAAAASSCTTAEVTGPVAYAAARPAVPAGHGTRRIRCTAPGPGRHAGGHGAAVAPAPGAALTILGPAPDLNPAHSAHGHGHGQARTHTSTDSSTHRARPVVPAHRPAGRHATGSAPVNAPAPRPEPLPVAGESPGSSTGTVHGLSSSAPGFLVPRAWTGTVTADPSLTGAVSDLSGLLSNGNRPPSFLIPIYMEAGKRYGVPWTVLAAINAIETDYGRDLNTSSAGAVGWMQFEPSTWHQWGVAADGHSVPNPYDPRDAIFSAARYLAAAGARLNLTQAIYAYNHAGWYVDEVLTRAQAIATHAQYERATVSQGTFSVFFATGARRRPAIRFRGGYLSHFDRLIAAANMVSAANFPYVWGGGHEQPARFGPFDCSGSVSYVLQQAGYKVPTTVSGDIPIWKFPAGPGRVTIFYNPIHTFMRIGNRYFGTSGFARPGGGAGWFDVNQLPASYLAGFREVHLPRLGPDSFSPTPHRAHRPA